MLLKRYKIPFAIFSFLFLVSCNDGPQVDVCISNPDINGFQCIAKDGKTSYFISYKDSKGVVGIKGDDLQTLLEWMKRNKN